MARAQDKRVGIFNFKNWPDKVTRPSLGDHSERVVDDFVKLLDINSNARVVGLEVGRDVITLVRRKRKARVDEKFVVTFDLYGSRTAEKTVALVLSDPMFREYLREMVEAASGREGFHTSGRSLIAGKVYTTTIGLG